MGNYSTTKKEIANYIFARVPLILIQSSERERVERMLRETAKEMKIEMSCYTDAKQVFQLGSNVTKDVDSDPLPFVAEQFRHKRNGTFVLGDVKRISEENLYSREIVNILYLALEQSCTLIIITPDTVWPRIAQMGMMTSLDYPDMKEREQQIVRFAERYSGRFPIEWQEPDFQRAAALLRGFTEIQIENILSATLSANRGLKKQHLYELTRQKSRMYAAVPCVQEVKVSEQLQVSGLENLKNWLQEKKKIFFMAEERLAERELQTPKGILLAGVPGCGKSFSARMVAKEWELPLFKFDIGSIYDKWVGESERKMSEALKFIDNVAPCVVWIDEIEKALAVSDSGNDTGKRVLGQFLFWLQESSSRVFLVATANDIQKLPPELFRKGRFSEMFFVDLPGRAERAEAIAQFAVRCLHRRLYIEEIGELVESSEGFSYADIEYVMKEAAQIALLYGDEKVTLDTVRELFRTVIPFAETNPDTVGKLREWGRNRALSASIVEEGGEKHE